MKKVTLKSTSFEGMGHMIKGLLKKRVSQKLALSNVLPIPLFLVIVIT